MSQIFYSSAVEGFLLSLGARRLSDNTIISYNRALQKFLEFLGNDLPVTDITTRQIESFLASMPELSSKSIASYYIALSSLWSWLTAEEITTVHLMRKIKRPKVERKEVDPLTESEVKALFIALTRSKIFMRRGKPVDRSLPQVERNRAIMLLMLDTGIRAQELCDLKVEDLDNRNNRIFVRMGKGMKERLLPFSPRTGQMIWRYLASRKDARQDEPLFISRINRALTRTKLAGTLRQIGLRAGVQNVHPHRFRHTFAIQYLRNGGNVYTLQSMLGHSSLNTVQLYLKIAQIDIDLVHKRASPVDGWRL